MFNRIREGKNLPKIIGDTNITPYWEIINNIIEESNLLIEILDARMPELSRNEKIESLVKTAKKELIFVLNKADLTSEKDIRKKLKKLQKENKTFIISNTERIGTKRLRSYLISLSKKYEKFKIGILGYPNTGKSSVINSLAKGKKVQVTSKAGTTHGKQWIFITKNLQLIDSPGVIPLQENDEIRHALIGSRNIEKIKDLEKVAHTIINQFYDKTIIEKFYDIKIDSKDPQDIIEIIARKKGFIKSKGEIDESRTAIKIIRDWQSGKLKV